MKNKELKITFIKAILFVLLFVSAFSDVIPFVENKTIKKAQALTGYIVPNGDNSANWNNVVNSTCAGGHWCTLDEDYTSPSVSDNVNETDNKANTDIYEMTTIEGVDVVNSIRVYLYTARSGNQNGSIDVNLNISGVDQTSQRLYPGDNGTYVWRSVVFSNLNISQSALDSIKVSMQSYKDGGGANETVYVATMYTSVDYSRDIPDQIHYRWRNDDGSESAASFATPEDSSYSSFPRNETKRLRVEISNEGVGTTTGQNFRLEVSGANPGSCSTASYQRIASSTHWDMSTSTYLTEGGATTNISPGITDENTVFVAGETGEVSDQTGGIILGSNNFTELEYSLIATNNAPYSANYCFRITDAGSDTIYNYSVYPQASIEPEPAPILDQIHYRWRNDNGSETGATFIANQDTAITGVGSSTNYRLRMEVSNEGNASSSPVDYRLEVSNPNPGNCQFAIYQRINASTHWGMATSSYFADASSTTNISSGLVDESTTFVPGEIKQLGDETDTITLDEDEFTELEFNLKATNSVYTGSTYCFRLTDAGSVSDFTYSKYPSLTTLGTPPPLPYMDQIHYRWRGDDWASGSWSYRKKITVYNSQVIGLSNLTNFPMLISEIDPDLRDTTNGGHVSSSLGYDIFFTNEDGVKLDHEIEQYSPTNGQMVAWAEIDVLDYNDDTILYMYYGGASSTDQQNIEGVWDSQYKAVHHLEESAASGGTYNDHLDSTSNNNDGEAMGGLNMSATGYINGADSFAGKASDDYVDIADDISLDITDDITISMWLRPASFTINSDLVTKGNYQEAYSTWINTDGTLEFGLERDTLLSSNSLMTATWYYLTFTRNILTEERKIFINGLLDASDIIAGPIKPSGDPALTFSSDAREFDGILDEVRVSNTAFLPRWIQTEYNSQSSTSTFYSLGSEETFALSFLANEDVKLANLEKNYPVRLRMEISNEGDASATTTYRLEVSEANPSSCYSTAYTRVDSSTHWNMIDSPNITDGQASSNVSPGLTDENVNFISGELKDLSDQTDSIALSYTDFTEIEFSLKATDNATDGADYCFRLTNAGSSQYFSYTRFAEASLYSYGSVSITAPSTASFTTQGFSYSATTSRENLLGEISISDDRSGSPGWSIDMTGEDWYNGTQYMDYDGDGVSTGQLQVDVNSAYLDVKDGSGEGINLGITDAFSASTSTINIITASPGNGRGVYNIEDIDLDQFIPASQAPGEYNMTLVFTIS